MLETKRCIIRRFKPEDAEDLQKVLSDPEVMEYIEPAFSLEKTREFILSGGLGASPLVWALELKETHHVIGHVIFHPYDLLRYEIGWILNRRYWNQGIASEVTKALIHYAKEQKIPALIMECAAGQSITKHIAEKNGFRLMDSDSICTYELLIKREVIMAEKILVVDDEREIADLIEVYLENENYEVYKFYSAKEAVKCIDSNEMDLAILDIMLPDISGFDICRYIRKKYNYPVIMLTAKDEEMDKITGLTLGADDYVTKPFRPLEMMARVKAQLRRYKKYNLSPVQKSNQKIIEHEGLELNIKTHQCMLDGEEIILTPTEFSILRILLENKGEVVSAEDLFHKIWKDEYYTKSNNTITVHIRHLREKIHDTVENPKFIKTIWGVGYKIEA